MIVLGVTVSVSAFNSSHHRNCRRASQCSRPLREDLVCGVLCEILRPTCFCKSVTTATTLAVCAEWRRLLRKAIDLRCASASKYLSLDSKIKITVEAKTTFVTILYMSAQDMPPPATTGARKNYCGLRGCRSSLGLAIDPGRREVTANRVAVCERGEQAAEPRHDRRARSGPGRSAPAEDHFRVCSLAGCQCLAHLTDERTGRRPRKIKLRQ